MLLGELKQLLTPITKVEELDVPVGLIQDIIFRLAFNEGVVTVSRFAEVLGLPARIMDEQLARMKQEHLVEVVKAGTLGSLSFTYGLTDAGSKRARDAFERSQYVGLAPVSLEAYNQAILAQTDTSQQITPEEVSESLSKLILPENFHRRIGPAVNAGTSLFLYGLPGNGKTTIAQAIAGLLAKDDPIWLPSTISVGGQIIRIYDPLVHEPVQIEQAPFAATPSTRKSPLSTKLKFDKRWRLFKRPSVMVGGELTMDSLDLRFEPVAKVYEAPLQLKANGGMFLIDDFGRQQISPQQLLNRWIVPLESGIDFLRLQSGQSLEVPFCQLIVFSTNLDPSDLVDDAFLRRIQMKVEVIGPDERLYYQIYLKICEIEKITFDKKSFVHLLQKWYREPERTMQAVHPRDIIKIVISLCEYEGLEPHFTPELIDEACMSYFVDMKK